MNKIYYASIILLITSLNSSANQQINNDFSRRYNANSHILNTPVYYKGEKSTQEKKARRAERRRTRRARRKQYSKTNSPA